MDKLTQDLLDAAAKASELDQVLHLYNDLKVQYEELKLQPRGESQSEMSEIEVDSHISDLKTRISQLEEEKKQLELNAELVVHIFCGTVMFEDLHIFVLPNFRLHWNKPTWTSLASLNV